MYIYFQSFIRELVNNSIITCLRLETFKIYFYSETYFMESIRISFCVTYMGNVALDQ